MSTSVDGSVPAAAAEMGPAPPSLHCPSLGQPPQPAHVGLWEILTATPGPCRQYCSELGAAGRVMCRNLGSPFAIEKCCKP